jgi:hypothetical protein
LFGYCVDVLFEMLDGGAGPAETVGAYVCCQLTEGALAATDGGLKASALPKPPREPAGAAEDDDAGLKAGLKDGRGTVGRAGSDGWAAAAADDG